MISHFTRGIDLRDKNLTRNRRIWLEYLCWCVSAWMDTHKPVYPIRLRVWLYRLYPDTVYQPQHSIDNWRRFDKQYKEQYKPWPWFIGLHCQGPFMPIWGRAASFFRGYTGGRSHRCEFTDKQSGALYGGTEGAFMDRYFELFLKNISLEDN